MRTTDTAAQLVQLRKSQLVGAVHDDGVRRRYVDAAFNDGRAQQQIEATVVKIQHHLLEVALAHLAVGNADLRLGNDSGQLNRHAIDTGHIVVQEIHLPAALDLAQAGLPDDRRVPLADEGLDREPVRRRRADDRQVAHAGQ